MTDELYVGVMSGTSMNGIDAVLASFEDEPCAIRATATAAYDDPLRRRLQAAAASPEKLDLRSAGELHSAVARAFASVVATLLDRAGAGPGTVRAIGSHGQTVLHQPLGENRISIQFGDPGTIAALTGITVVADFRNADIALGGQGAPLVPAFHRRAFGSEAEDRAVVNIGGIANLTLLYRDGSIGGFDTGPGNVLLDQWCREHIGKQFDDRGAWAAGGEVSEELLAVLRGDDYFAAGPPKSTGTDHFNLRWLNERLRRCGATVPPQNVQATLAELTAREIALPLKSVSQIALCGGGARNDDLVERIRSALPDARIGTTADWGLDPEWVEAAAFAWLARQRLRDRPTSVPSVTGASGAVSLGGVYLPPAGA